MPSHADQRRLVELALRAVVLAVLGIALWRSVNFAESRVGTIATRSSRLDATLTRALSQPSISRVALMLDGTPSTRQRDALVAMRRAGAQVSWSGEIAPLAAQVVPARDPWGGAQVRVLGARARVIVADSAGVLDTLRAGASSSLDVGALVGRVRTTDGATAALAATPDAATRKAVLVLGRADWESKFVMSALSEAGWLVRARIPSAPGVEVRDDGLLPIDTARYDAVVALDTSAADFAPAIVRFVQQGGGLVVAGAGLGVAALRAVAPSGAASRIPGRILLAEDTVLRRDLPITPLNNVRSDAVVLERQANGLALAARRSGLGRVLAFGYDESWRWRMLGGESGLAAHRTWWSRAVASVTPERASNTPAGIDAAPRVAMIRALGPASVTSAELASTAPNPLPIWLILVAIAAALAEIASRRFRGER